MCYRFLIFAIEKIFCRHLEKTDFIVIDRCNIPDPRQIHKTQSQRLKTRDSFSADVDLCFSRACAQLDISFDKKQRNVNNVVRDDQYVILVIFVDPSVKQRNHIIKSHANQCCLPFEN